jgi:hypothetical protein
MTIFGQWVATAIRGPFKEDSITLREANLSLSGLFRGVRDRRQMRIAADAGATAYLGKSPEAVPRPNIVYSPSGPRRLMAYDPRTNLESAIRDHAYGKGNAGKRS